MKKFDLVLLDTVIYQAYEYRVVSIKGRTFELKRISPGRVITAPERLIVNKKDYQAGLYKMRRANIAPVKCYKEAKKKQ